MHAEQFLNKKFPGLALEPPLYYSWDASIRFELGVNESDVSIHENVNYLPGVYRRVVTLFNAVHSPGDEIYLIADVIRFPDSGAFNRKIHIFSKYVKKIAVLHKLQEKTIAVNDPDDEYTIHRFSLKCNVRDIAYIPLLKAICNQDMGVKPKTYHRVYFVNISKDTIFHVYDDRGSDVAGSTPGDVRNLYETYNDWILDYDRKEIDEVFKR